MPPEPVFLDSRVAESLAGSGGAAFGHVAGLPARRLLTSGLRTPHPGVERSRREGLR